MSNEITIDRVATKIEAKQQLKGKLGWFAPSGIVAIVCVLITEFITPNQGSISFMSFSNYELVNTGSTFLGTIITGIVLLITIINIVNFAHIALSVAKGESKPSAFSAFSDGEFSRSIFSALRVNVFTFLWTLLLIIPGIVKNYAYSFTYFITKDDPKLSPKEAQKTSIALTNGYKAKLFVIGLSFFPWYLLAIIPVVGVFIIYLWIIPYVTTTLANVYLQIRGEGASSNSHSLDDLASHFISNSQNGQSATDSSESNQNS